jgi:mRNA-degrading endonuclease RelE of RelBE toxin-antitoxin system
VKSHTTQRFRDAYDKLPDPIRQQADKAYQLFRQNPQHPSLRFKQVHPERAIYSVRISSQYRALAVADGDDIIWFWIGSHADYDRLLTAL